MQQAHPRRRVGIPLEQKRRKHAERETIGSRYRCLRRSLRIPRIISACICISLAAYLAESLGIPRWPQATQDSRSKYARIAKNSRADPGIGIRAEGVLFPPSPREPSARTHARTYTRTLLLHSMQRARCSAAVELPCLLRLGVNYTAKPTIAGVRANGRARLLGYPV